MISCRRLIIEGATVFDLYQEKVITVVFCYIITIPVTEYREREWWGGGGGLLGNTCESA